MKNLKETTHTPTLTYTPDETSGLSNAKAGHGHLRVNGTSVWFGPEEVILPIVHAVNERNSLLSKIERLKRDNEALLETAKYLHDQALNHKLGHPPKIGCHDCEVITQAEEPKNKKSKGIPMANMRDFDRFMGGSFPGKPFVT